jgi:hypothetical protein
MRMSRHVRDAANRRRSSHARVGGACTSRCCSGRQTNRIQVLTLDRLLSDLEIQDMELAAIIPPALSGALSTACTDGWLCAAATVGLSAAYTRQPCAHRRLRRGRLAAAAAVALQLRQRRRGRPI